MTADNQAQRFRSALPAQSLALLNSPLVMRATKAFTAQLLEQSKGDPQAALARAFEAAYSRPPTPPELALGKEALSSSGDPAEGLRLFVQAMFGANDFLYTY